ncbi:N-acetylmuramoyl-L-alanine amidase [Falsibacillus pallidus]|uniref:N-acetylmuramoyl-L-alanine amidase n=1 Tax=Falsibacillus pallidus TaxID=493781 RepID=A0A370GBD8_9BACI|nr:N-acetylmuramoyl-L-alanine amidase [Falsibacillus pallidus]RDI41041.1 N-acetylmuramoyl-L-alanine amidase [Falsibacillus pallidus]
MKLMLDAGHGYGTPGKSTPDGFPEYAFNRKVAMYAKNLFETYEGIEVYLPHSDYEDVPLSERTERANSLKMDCYVSIHANAFGDGSEWTSPEGIETYVYVTKPKEAMMLANAVQSKLVKETGRQNRGVKTANFHVLRETKMTAILVECGFMTNKIEGYLLQMDPYQQQCATAIAEAIASFYHLSNKPGTCIPN